MKVLLRGVWLVVLLSLIPLAAQARALVVKQVLTGAQVGKELLTNGDLEKTDQGQIVGVEPWDKGYVIDSEARSGKVSARCTIEDLKAGEEGLTYPVELNQRRPVPFTATLWSKAKDVGGTPDSNYSLYIDLMYMDGTELWGQIAAFSTGTHDWQQRCVTVVPDKPIKTVSFHAIFRKHTGTAWFDDFSFAALNLPAGAGIFDGVPVTKVAPAAAGGPAGLPLPRTSALPALDPKTGQWRVPWGGTGGLFLRDATRKSDFRQPLGTVTTAAGGRPHFEGVDEELGLKVVADYHLDNLGGWHVEGTVESLTGEDRGVSIYCALPGLKATRWYDDMRTGRAIEPNQTYSLTQAVGCGANGQMSRYPFSCVDGPVGQFSLGAPLDPPHLYRFAYDSGSGELYGVEDLGLTKDYRTPNKATFSFVIYRSDHGFRGALDRYYKLYPSYFTKRNQTEGNWMAFDPISGVQDPEDFHFAFKEGNNDTAYDEAHGILTYVYVEPMSYWLALGKLPRTSEAALKLLQEQAAQKPPRAQASATLTSGVRLPDGSLRLSIQNTPWCDGALFINSPDPHIPTTPQLPYNQSMVLWQSINGALGKLPADLLISGWRPWVDGFAVAPKEGRNGTQAAVINRPTVGTAGGLGQSVSINQKAPGKIIVSAWCKAEGVTGETDKDFSLYCDASLASGEPSWGHVVPFTVGTHDWEKQELVIDVPERVTSLSLWLLFRGNHTGKVWFDDVSITAAGSDQNLVVNGGLEPQPKPQTAPALVDGTYIDSLEMAASDLDFAREHWKVAEAPLVYSTQEGQPAEMLMFGVFEFIKDVSEKMHAQGKTIFANSALHRFAQPAAVLDLMGTETNWHSQGKWTPMHDVDCNFKRALCYQRPYLLLQNTVFQDFPVEMVEKYMARSIFYGLMPSFFSHNAATETYWTRPEIYNRDRSLFKEYMPAAQQIAAAGWEPLTFATTGNPKVYIERWGRGDNLYFTLFNDSDSPQAYRLTVDHKALGTKLTGLTDVIAGTAAAPAGTLAPETLRVVKLVK